MSQNEIGGQIIDLLARNPYHWPMKSNLVTILFSCLAFYSPATAAKAVEYRLSHDFGPTPLGSTKEMQWNLRAKNEEILKIKSIKLDGEGFNLVTNCSAELPQGQKCNLKVTYTPIAEKLHSGHLIVDLHSEVLIFDLSGSGVPKNAAQDIETPTQEVYETKS